MDTLDTVVVIAEIILFLVLAVLGIYLIVSLKKITKTMDKVQQDVEGLQKKIEPVLDNAQVISSNVAEITNNVKLQVAKVETIVDSVKERADSIIEFEKNTQREVESQVNNVLNLVSSFSTGVRTFIKALTGSDNLPGKRKSYTPLSETSDEDF
ncbi:MAG: DUF948 domain-containing protein [Ignavibacteriae bacterium]|nr:MAG: DUF948 domain-containing protein [Ignavibacteriota bacterium]